MKRHFAPSSGRKKSPDACHYCGRHMVKEPINQHKNGHGMATKQHIIPVREGGKGLHFNKRPCCMACNNTLAIAMECPAMMMCAFMVAETSGLPEGRGHTGARTIIKRWRVNLMTRENTSEQTRSHWSSFGGSSGDGPYGLKQHRAKGYHTPTHPSGRNGHAHQQGGKGGGVVRNGCGVGPIPGHQQSMEPDGSGSFRRQGEAGDLHAPDLHAGPYSESSD